MRGKRRGRKERKKKKKRALTCTSKRQTKRWSKRRWTY